MTSSALSGREHLRHAYVSMSHDVNQPSQTQRTYTLSWKNHGYVDGMAHEY